MRSPALQMVLPTQTSSFLFAEEEATRMFVPLQALYPVLHADFHQALTTRIVGRKY